MQLQANVKKKKNKPHTPKNPKQTDMNIISNSMDFLIKYLNKKILFWKHFFAPKSVLSEFLFLISLFSIYFYAFT